MNTTSPDLEYWQNLHEHTIPFNGLLSLLSTSLAVYMILYKSNTQIQTYKWFLLNIVAWTFITDVYLSIFYAPRIVMNGRGIAPRGLLKIVGNYTIKRIEFVSILILKITLKI
jgi:hypothetical protein